jgi:hypothetical protein
MEKPMGDKELFDQSDRVICPFMRDYDHRGKCALEKCLWHLEAIKDHLEYLDRTLGRWSRKDMMRSAEAWGKYLAETARAMARDHADYLFTDRKDGDLFAAICDGFKKAVTDAD